VTPDYPSPKKLNGEVLGVEIDIGEDAIDLDHLITPEERLRIAMAIQEAHSGLAAPMRLPGYWIPPLK